MPTQVKAYSCTELLSPDGTVTIVLCAVPANPAEANALRDQYDCLVEPNGRTNLECEECE